MTLKLKTGVPIPDSRFGRSAARLGQKYSSTSKWAIFDVGSSCFFPAKATKRRHKIAIGAQTWGKTQTPERKFVSRATEENGMVGITIWRIA